LSATKAAAFQIETMARRQATVTKISEPTGSTPHFPHKNASKKEPPALYQTKQAIL